MTVGILALGAGGLLIIGAAIWMFIRREDGGDGKPPRDPEPPADDRVPLPEPRPATPDDMGNDDVPTLSVVALGLVGAGKSVLLGSQARELRPAASRRFHFDCDLEQNRILAQLHSEVRDTGGPWPPATGPGDEREFLFACKASDRSHRQRTIFRINYFDYPGEALTPGVLTGSGSELESKVERAHALLVMLDGQRVLALLNGHDAVHDEFEDQVWPMIALAHRAQCPVQLIITKWDLVQTFGSLSDDELLRRVWAQLERHSVIKQLVHAHCQRNEEVRLIPVSAVGSQFAELCPDGTVAKRENGVLEPVNVDVPLCAVIPDLLRRVEQSLDESVRKQLDDEVDRVPVDDVSVMAQSVLSSRVGTLVQNALAVLVGDFVVTWFVETLVRTKWRKAPEPPVRGGASETLRLRLEVIEDMEQFVDEFEDKLRGSILCRRPRVR